MKKQVRVTDKKEAGGTDKKTGWRDRIGDRPA